MIFPLAITGTGLVTGVGLNTLASCAAIRCSLDSFQSIQILDHRGDWYLGCPVQMNSSWRGESKLIKMVTLAIRECLATNSEIDTLSTPLILCLSETDRVGRDIEDDHQFFVRLEEELQLEFNENSRVVSSGPVSIAIALKHARNLIQQHNFGHVVIAATDSLLNRATLEFFENRGQLLTDNNSNGFIPGEAAAALVIEPVHSTQRHQFTCQGFGFGIETANVNSEQPLRADGLTTAIKDSLIESNIEMGDLDFRITDCSGEQYSMKEATLALSRTLRKRKEEFDIWHPADCIGEVGTAIGLIMIAVLKTACEKKYSKGCRMMAHLGNDDGKRASMIFKFANSGDL